MTDAINSSNRIKSPGPPANHQAKSPSRDTAGSSVNPTASAVVELTSDQVMEQMKQLPEVDNQRVQAIKNALANGEYQPDPEVIAAKFAEIEKLLP